MSTYAILLVYHSIHPPVQPSTSLSTYHLPAQQSTYLGMYRSTAMSLFSSLDLCVCVLISKPMVLPLHVSTYLSVWPAVCLSVSRYVHLLFLSLSLSLYIYTYTKVIKA